MPRASQSRDPRRHWSSPPCQSCDLGPTYEYHIHEPLNGRRGAPYRQLAPPTQPSQSPRWLGHDQLLGSFHGRGSDVVPEERYCFRQRIGGIPQGKPPSPKMAYVRGPARLAGLLSNPKLKGSCSRHSHLFKSASCFKWRTNALLAD